MDELKREHEEKSVNAFMLKNPPKVCHNFHSIDGRFALECQIEREKLTFQPEKTR